MLYSLLQTVTQREGEETCDPGVLTRLGQCRPWIACVPMPMPGSNCVMNNYSQLRGNTPSIGEIRVKTAEQKIAPDQPIIKPIEVKSLESHPPRRPK